MELCLSGRMFTTPGTNDRFDLGIEDFISFARRVGYDGICTRRGQLDERTTDEEATRIAELLKANNAVCSFVMSGTIEDRVSYEGLCRVVDHAVGIGCRHVQPSVRDEGGIPWAQKLCDFAAERGVRVCPQLHDATLHDNVPNCLSLFEEVDRENFGLNFEASHLILQGAEIRGADAIAALGDRVFTVCCQNYKKVGDASVPVLPGDPDGVDFDEVFGALKGIGFDGFVTHMSGAYPDMDNETVCGAYVRKLRSVM